jgi:Pyruvate/2-oxoacid:ferredoxin oxidoreductase delta subunit
VAGDIGLPEADFKHSSAVNYEGTNFTICRGVLEADAIVSLPKMKTHALERITGAVKNMYGCVHGFHKAAGHTRHPDSKSFGAMLAKLERGVKPRLHIMDGVVAMEGNGPASGDPVKMNVILASGDPYALDEVFCRLIALNPALVPTNTHAPDRDVVIRTPLGEISWLDAFRQYGVSGFRVDRSVDAKTAGGADNRLTKAMQQRPVIQKDLCQSCKVCVESCPLSGKALNMQGQYPVYDYDQCIRCFCCQEMCPHGAISVSRS